MGLASEGLKGLARARELLDMSRKARMERAREMGFDTERVLYHGTTADVRAFDPTLAGTVREGFGDAVWMTPDADLASQYAANAARDPEYQVLEEWRAGALRQAQDDLRDMVQRGERITPEAYRTLPSRQSYDEMTGMMRGIEAEAGAFQRPIEGASVYPLRVRGELMTFDAGGRHFREVNDQALEQAQDGGFAGVRIVNVVDPPNAVSREPTETVAVFDPSNIRSVNAAFDPAKRDSSNLLAGVGGAAVGAGLLAPQEADAAPFGTLARQLGKRTREAWHGSPHVYDQVDLSRMGSGEGAQAYGAGYYAADARSVAEGYRDSLAPGSGPTTLDMAARALRDSNDDTLAAISGLLGRRDKIVIEGNPAMQEQAERLWQAAQILKKRPNSARSALYRLEIPDEDLLDWDAPLSEQPWFRPVDEVVAEYQAAGKKPDAYSRLISKANAAKDQTGRQFYEDQLAQFGGDQSRVSAFMNEAGIPGIRYLDGVSRDAGEGTRNYVIFDDANVNVVERNGEPIAAMPRGREEPMSAAAGFARPGMMAAAGAGGAVAAYDPVEARQTARRKREIDGLVDAMLEDFRRSAAAPRPDAPRFETLAQLAEWARAQRTVGMPLYGQPLAGTADTLERLAYGDYRPGREGLGTLAMDAATTAAEVFDPGTWASLGRQAQQDLINQLSDWRTRANR